jgi:UPF0271 protein
LSGLRCFTSTLVYDEIRHIKKSLSALDVLIDSGNLVILEPEVVSIATVITAAKISGDFTMLSEADISILALAYELKRILITNDYRIANVAASLQVVVKTIAINGIKSIRQWIAICPACEKLYPPGLTECKNCGNRLKYKYKTKPKA